MPAEGTKTSLLGFIGRFARSVAMITQRPTIGSLRSSDIRTSISDCRFQIEDLKICNLKSAICNSSYIPHPPLEIRRRPGQGDDSFARGPVATLAAFEQLHIELDRRADANTELVERNCHLDDAIDGEGDAVGIGVGAFALPFAAARR